MFGRRLAYITFGLDVLCISNAVMPCTNTVRVAQIFGSDSTLLGQLSTLVTPFPRRLRWAFHPAPASTAVVTPPQHIMRQWDVGPPFKSICVTAIVQTCHQREYQVQHTRML